MVRYPGSVFSTMSKMRNKNALDFNTKQANLQIDAAREAKKAAEEQADAERSTGIGRLIGKLGGGGLGLGIAALAGLNPLTAALAIGGAAGLGSGIGGAIGHKDVDPGLFNVTEDTDWQDKMDTKLWTDPLQDALTTGLMAYTMGADFSGTNPFSGSNPGPWIAERINYA